MPPRRDHLITLVPAHRHVRATGQRHVTAVSHRESRTFVKDGPVTSSDIPSTVVEAISVLFAEHEVASLCLPSGWFGRPHDNWHQLSEVAIEGDDVLVRLDDRQVLRLTAEGTSLEGRVLRVMIREGRWDWTEYGGDQERSEALGPGNVEFHAPFHP
jgi:hypothetical protein